MVRPGGEAEEPANVGILEYATGILDALDQRFDDIRAGILIDLERSVVKRTWVMAAPDPKPYVSMAKADAHALEAYVEQTDGPTDPTHFSMALRTDKIIQYSALLDSLEIPFLLSVAIGRESVNLELLRRTLVDEIEALQPRG